MAGSRFKSPNLRYLKLVVSVYNVCMGFVFGIHENLFKWFQEVTPKMLARINLTRNYSGEELVDDIFLHY